MGNLIRWNKLDGWSDSVYENIDDYDDTFEELYDKYGKANFHLK
jgi:hypothetical protein